MMRAMNTHPHIAPDGSFICAPVSRRVLNLGDLLTQTARRVPDRPALAWRDQIWDWATFNARVDAFAHALAANGVAKGERVLIQSRNNNAMWEAMWACFKLGAIIVPANFRQTPPEFAHLAQQSIASVLLCDDAFPDHATAARAVTPSLRLVVWIGQPQHSDPNYESLVSAHGGKPFAACAVTYDDPLWFFFTSGTTGRPKAAVLTHGQMGFIVTNHLADLVPGLSEFDASLVVAPLSHGAGIHQLMQVARGAVTVLMPGEKLDVDEAWRLIAQWRISNMFTVPTILTMLSDHPSCDLHDHSSLKHVIYAGSPMYRADQIGVLQKLGPCITQYFGLGEVTGCITVLPPRAHDADDARQGHLGSCGWPRTGMDVRIFDDSGVECAAGVTGEICVAGPGVFAGYFNDESANAKAFRDGFFRTGDLGHMDSQGFVFITGRASDMYISGGSNIYPREIEEVLLMHQAVAEVAIVGIPDARWGEIGIAAVVLRDGAYSSEAELLGHLEGKVARYKMPARIVFWPELPKSGYGKVPKRLIREKLLQSDGKTA